MGNVFSSQISNGQFAFTTPSAYTPTAANAPSTFTFASCFYFRRGHVVVMYGSATAGSADGAASRLQFNIIPSGLSLNTTYTASDLNMVCGAGAYFKSGTGSYPGVCYVRTGSGGSMYMQPASTALTFTGSLVASSDAFYWYCEMPIQGWG